MTLEEQLQELIREQFKSQRAFALLADMPETTLSSMLKRGIKNASFSHAVKLCRILKIDTDELAQGKISPRRQEPVEPTNDERKLIAEYRLLPDDAQDTVRKVMSAFHCKNLASSQLKANVVNISGNHNSPVTGNFNSNVGI